MRYEYGGYVIYYSNRDTVEVCVEGSPAKTYTRIISINSYHLEQTGLYGHTGMIYRSA